MWRASGRIRLARVLRSHDRRPRELRRAPEIRSRFETYMMRRVCG